MPSISVCKWRKEGQKYLKKKKFEKKTSKNDIKNIFSYLNN